MPRLTHQDHKLKSPPIKDLDLYSNLLLQGKKDEEICEALYYDLPTYNRLQPFFLFHFREFAKNRYLDQNKNLDERFPLTDTLKDKFLDCLQAGQTIAKAAQMIGIPLPVVVDVWYKNEEFKTLATYASEMAVIKVEKALYKRATGFEHEAGSDTVVESEGLDKEGNSICTKTTTKNRSQKIVYPDVSAAKYYLWNRNPDRWSREGDSNDASRNDKGKILEFIDKETKDDPQS
jgi:hypothetical protein